jgi:uncharacterized membrane protein
MPENQPPRVICQICGQEKELSQVWPGELIREGVQQTIRRTHPDWSQSGYICLPDLNHFRAEYVEGLLQEDLGQTSSLQQQVVNSIKEHDLLSRNINIQFEEELSFWDRLSDRVASFGGSWGFITGFLVVIIIWVVINTMAWMAQPFDPYPYIFLNLILSGLAGFQAPIILMSQNRQDTKDRLRSEYDYRINLKAELEIRHLHEKLDLLLNQQWRRLLEIQRVQLQVMEELGEVCRLAGKQGGP